MLSLLNDRYIILDENAAPLTNRNAMGNAWFVSKAVRASTADEEIALLGSADLRTEAVLGPDFADVQIPAAADTLDSIVLTEYAPNELRYHYRLSAPRAAVFSEIWYPSGWTAQADGEAVDLFRTDWTLRGAVLPAGEHDLVLRFDPPSYKLSSNDVAGPGRRPGPGLPAQGKRIGKRLRSDTPQPFSLICQVLRSD